MHRADKAVRWTATDADALMLGGLLTYGWLGFLLTARLHGASTIPGQFVPLMIVLAVVYFGIVRRKLPSGAGATRNPQSREPTIALKSGVCLPEITGKMGQSPYASSRCL